MEYDFKIMRIKGLQKLFAGVENIGRPRSRCLHNMEYGLQKMKIKGLEELFRE